MTEFIATIFEWDEVQRYLQEALRAEDRARELMKLNGPVILQQAFQLACDECPMLGGFVWTQFTPYFNDGSPCVFRLGEIVPFPVGLDHADLGRDALDALCEPAGDEPWFDPTLYQQRSFAATDGTSVDYWVTGPELDAATKAFQKFMCDEMMLALFGDHVMVVYTQDGADVREWEDHH